MLTVEQVQREKQEAAQKQNKFLLDIGYNKEGVFVLRFPNGKSYIGSSKQMGKRLQQIFRELFVPPRKGQRVTADWIKAAKAENLGMKSFEDLEVITKEVGDYDLKALKQEAVVIETEINGRELY